MAKWPALQALRFFTGLGPEAKAPVASMNTAAYSFSASERDRIIGNIAAEPASSEVTKDSVQRYVNEMSKRVSDNRKDNQEILRLAPEVNQTSKIVIPSIMAPNDLRDADVSFICDSPELSEDERNRVGKVVTEYMNRVQKLRTRVPEWIHEALFASGAKPLLTVPLSELDDFINNPAAVIGRATEHLQMTDLIKIFNDKTNDSLLGINGSGTIVGSFEEYSPALESLFNSRILSSSEEKKNKSYNDSKAEINKNFDPFAREIVESLEVLDNPDVLKIKNLRKKGVEDIAKKMETRYKTSSVLSINDDHKEVKGHPLTMELPTEAVIPIFTPGSPFDHVGYFILLDGDGNPMTFIDNYDDGPKSLNLEQRSTFDNLFKAMGFTDIRSYGSHQSELMTDIYGMIINRHLKSKLDNVGLPHVEINIDNAVYRYMLTRYLSKRKTRVLFVPKSFLTYFCYQFNDNGTGRSKLEDSKFILALRITLLVCRTLTAMNNSVDRRQLDITLDERVGNPFEFIEAVKRDYFAKNIVSFSIDPDEVTRSQAQRALSVNVRGYPGAQNFEVKNVPNERSASPIDEQLSEDIRSLLILSLGVPPAALNALSQEEYATSVVTTNILFSRDISHYQTVTCTNVDEYVHGYIAHDQALTEKILEAVAESTNSSNHPDISAKHVPEGGTATIKDKKKKSKDKEGSDKKDPKSDIGHIIKHIHMVLPPPNIAPDTTQLKELGDFIQAIDVAIKAIIDDEMFADDREKAEKVQALRAYLKSDLVQKHVARLGMGSSISFEGITSINPKDFLEVRQAVYNLAKALEDQKKIFGPAPDGAGDEGGLDFNQNT